MRDGVPLVVSVISAKAEVDGKRVSLGSALQIPLSQLMDALQALFQPQRSVRNALVRGKP
jgi:hypothetical protein